MGNILLNPTSPASKKIPAAPTSNATETPDVEGLDGSLQNPPGPFSGVSRASKAYATETLGEGGYVMWHSAGAIYAIADIDSARAP